MSATDQQRVSEEQVEAAMDAYGDSLTGSVDRLLARDENPSYSYEAERREAMRVALEAAAAARAALPGPDADAALAASPLSTGSASDE